MTDEEEMRKLALLRRREELIALVELIDRELIAHSKSWSVTGRC